MILFLCVAAHAQDGVRVRAELAPAELPFHRTATYRIIVDAPEGLSVPAPELKDVFDGLELRTTTPRRDPLPDGGERTTYTWILDPIEVRSYTLPEIALEWDGGRAVLPPLGLKVRELSPAEEDAVAMFDEVAGPAAVAPKPLPLAWIALAVVCALALAAAAYYYWRRKPEEAPKRVRPPWEIARLRLRELKRRQLPEHGKFGAFYVDLSAILRYYIEDRFQVHAPEQTTPEFLDAAAASGVLSEEQQAGLADFLRHCDRVKFARYEPSLEEMAKSFETVERFVGETVPQTNAVASEEAA